MPQLPRPEGADSAVLDPAQLASLRDLQRPTEGDILQVFADLFTADVPQRLVALRVAVRDGDRQAIIRGAHAIKAGAAGLGAERLRAACAELEASAATTTGDQGSVLLDRIDAAYAATCEALRQELTATA